MLYAAPVWTDELKYKKYEENLQKAQRKAVLRICAAYRTAPTEALLVLAGVSPNTFLATKKRIKAEKNNKIKKKKRNDKTVAKIM